MLTLGHILISDLVVTDLFIHSLLGSYDSSLLGCTRFLKIVSVRTSVCVSPPPMLLITNGVI